MENEQVLTVLSIIGAIFFLILIVIYIIVIFSAIYEVLETDKLLKIMETKNEQNISDILESFVNTIKKDKDVKSALVLIETKYDRIIQVKGRGTSISESLYELCKVVPSIKHTLKVALFVLEKEKQEKVTDESN